MSRFNNAEIPFLSSREEYFNLFDGITEDVPTELDRRYLPGGLLKSYLLETVGEARTPDGFNRMMARSDLHASMVDEDETLYRITDEVGAGIGLAEKIDNRYFALYTLLPARVSDSLVKRAVASNPLVDHLWLSSQGFNSLWDHVRSVNSGRRYGKITFEHESIYDLSINDAEPENRNVEDERRASRFTMVDRLDVIHSQMGPLQATYAPLASITHIRMPAASRGGHDLYYDGKVTNRSDSFLDHRGAILNVIDMYSRLTSRIEDVLWVSGSSRGGGFSLQGAVAELVFSETLEEPLFKRWVMSLFNNRRNRFRITGFPTWLSDRKVHADAIDQHLWQPFMMEMTPNHVVAVLPKGTCGNTINRLVSNVQRLVDPKVKAYIGDLEYSELVPRTGSIEVA